MMDSRTFNRLTTPEDKVLTSIEGEMSSILKDESIPEDVKVKLYASAQSRYQKIEPPHEEKLPQQKQSTHRMPCWLIHLKT